MVVFVEWKTFIYAFKKLENILMEIIIQLEPSPNSDDDLLITSVLNMFELS